LSREISTGGAGGGERQPGAPSVLELSLVKSVDSASAPLFSAATARTTPFPEVTLDLNIGASQPIARVELENVLVSSQGFRGSAGGEARPTETIKLNFTKITFTYIQPNDRTTYTTYNLVTGQSSTGGNAGTDTDNDGMPDAWESLYGLSVGSNDSNGDRDGDGLSNLHEFQLGTLPNSGTSFFKAQLTPDPSSPNNFLIQWNSVAGKTYLIEWSPDLTTPFTTIRTVTATAASTTENITRAGNLGFYRVRPQ
jgi:type VI protein secretion system component Hcp